jgi:excisionase family DNA binding protein
MNSLDLAFTNQKQEFISDSDEWFTTKQASQYLGISTFSLLNEVSSGRVPYYKFGKRNRYLKSELDTMILKNKRGPLWE